MTSVVSELKDMANKTDENRAKDIVGERAWEEMINAASGLCASLCAQRAMLASCIAALDGFGSLPPALRALAGHDRNPIP